MAGLHREHALRIKAIGLQVVIRDRIPVIRVKVLLQVRATRVRIPVLQLPTKEHSLPVRVVIRAGLRIKDVLPAAPPDKGLPVRAAIGRRDKAASDRRVPVVRDLLSDSVPVLVNAPVLLPDRRTWTR